MRLRSAFTDPKEENMFAVRLVTFIFVTAGIIFNAGAAIAQDYPNKPIRIITSLPGGVTDFTARLVALELTRGLGQQMIVDNRGSGVVTAEMVAKAPPDGYTLLVTGSSFWIGPLLRKTSYDPIKDFPPVSFLVNSPNILVVHPSVAAKSVKDLIALAKAKPGTLNYASSGTGGALYLPAELFKSMSGANIVHVPYKGAGPAITAVIGGEVQMLFAIAGSVVPHIKSGKLTALGVTSLQPSALVPGLPTVASTIPGYAAGSETVMFASPDTPAAIINRLSRETIKSLNQADVKEKFLAVGAEVVASSPKELTTWLRSETVKWGKLIKDNGIREE
jgi:tripartite-type tricarboxylate transporter receptor subunit TctC